MKNKNNLYFYDLLFKSNLMLDQARSFTYNFWDRCIKINWFKTYCDITTRSWNWFAYQRSKKFE